jgi:hypothetical protein
MACIIDDGKMGATRFLTAALATTDTTMTISDTRVIYNRDVDWSFDEPEIKFEPVEPPPCPRNTIPRRTVRAFELFMRRARSALPMRWGTYQGAF